MANEPDLIQRLLLDFNVVSDLTVDFQSLENDVEVEFGTIYTFNNSRILYATTATWNSKPTLVSERGYMYVYSDWKQNEQQQNIAGFKFGDGLAYVIDLPFVDDQLWTHINNNVIHVTQQEREFWNNKVSIRDVQNENLIFTTQ